jgi:3-dehydroquinate synthase
MADLPVFDQIVIQSNSGSYSVDFSLDGAKTFLKNLPSKSRFVVDAKVASLYWGLLQDFVDPEKSILVHAAEESKEIRSVADTADKLIRTGMRKDHSLVAIGGGIVQDISCFLASTLFRGIAWHFLPTTLLAQSDSCIGSKSSINLGAFKNILGTFYPPKSIHVDLSFLDTLQNQEILSGIGEMLKVHVLAGQDKFQNLARDYDQLQTSRNDLLRYVRDSLLIKKHYIEQDEFDRTTRRVMNYGHSFGHAIESAVNFEIPHGVAVTIGMDMANYVAWQLDKTTEGFFHEHHKTFVKNYSPFRNKKIPLNAFFEAIAHDKKNVGEDLTLILPNRSGDIEVCRVAPGDSFKEACASYFGEVL